MVMFLGMILLNDVFDHKFDQIVMKARPSLLLFESANPRHAHEVQFLAQLQTFIFNFKYSFLPLKGIKEALKTKY